MCHSSSCVDLNLDANCPNSDQIYGAHNLLGSLLLWSLLLVHLIFPFCSRNSLHLHIVICMTMLTVFSFFSCVCVFSCVWEHVWGHVCGDWGWLQEFSFFSLLYSFGQGIPLSPVLMTMTHLAIQFALKILLCLLSIGMSDGPLAYLAVTLFGDLNVRFHACMENTLTPELPPRNFKL